MCIVGGKHAKKAGISNIPGILLLLHRGHAKVFVSHDFLACVKHLRTKKKEDPETLHYMDMTKVHTIHDCEKKFLSV